MSKLFYQSFIYFLIISMIKNGFETYAYLYFDLHDYLVLPYTELIYISFAFKLIGTFFFAYYCFKKKYLILLFALLISNFIESLMLIDFYYVLAEQQSKIFISGDAKLLSLIINALFFIAILISKSRKQRWLVLYSIAGLFGLTLIYSAQMTLNFPIFEKIVWISCLFPILLVINFQQESSILTLKNDEIIDD